MSDFWDALEQRARAVADIPEARAKFIRRPGRCSNMAQRGQVHGLHTRVASMSIKDEIDDLIARTDRESLRQFAKECAERATSNTYRAGFPQDFAIGNAQCTRDAAINCATADGHIECAAYAGEAATLAACADDYDSSLKERELQLAHLNELHARDEQKCFDAVAKIRQEFKESGDELIAMLEELGVR